MKRYLLLSFLLVAWFGWVGCEPKPDKSLILWEQPSPKIAAQLHAAERDVLKALEVLPTGSMEPFLTGGDYIVVDFSVPYDSIKKGDLLIYKARWLPQTDEQPVVCHMAASKQGDEWIMDGIHNEHYESSKEFRMGRKEYRAKVIQVYTKRKKP